MVFVVPPSEEPDCLNAYIVSALPDTDLKALKNRFERAAALRFNPAIELVIKRCPAAYTNLSHADIRRAETTAGREGAFVIIDERAEESRGHAVWYVEDFAGADMVANGLATSTEVLVEILVRIESLAITHINASISIQGVDELLQVECGVEFPLVPGFTQPQIHGSEELEDGDVSTGVLFAEAECIAEMGEYEESTDPALLKEMNPRPDVVVRLRREAAVAAGLVPDQWCWKEEAEDVEMPDGTTKSFPPGSLQMCVTYDVSFPWPKYDWPEGSL